MGIPPLKINILLTFQIPFGAQTLKNIDFQGGIPNFKKQKRGLSCSGVFSKIFPLCIRPIKNMSTIVRPLGVLHPYLTTTF